jgi:glutamate formiminotransferase/formiminotetrahydrofolate cyclodeaminase
MPVVECVPNFSEGRDDTVIGAIAGSIAAVPGAHLLDVDSGYGSHRTVMTIVGDEESISEAAFQAVKTAASLIDMRNHQGAHPRLGATDVCPFVPLRDVTLKDCARIAEELGARVAQELDIPVFLYGEAARSLHRRSLPDVRRGQYEGLTSRFDEPGSEPDFGRAVFNEKAGATIIGARPVLIAFNVNLKTKSTKIASTIAADIRESGRVAKDAEGNALVDAEGNQVRRKGTLRACRAVGWYVEEFDCAQVSTNLLDYKVTSLHQAYDEIKSQAERLNIEVTGSELVGLVPLEAMLLAGHYFAEEKSNDLQGEEALVELAIASMGLRSVKRFDPRKKILDYQLRSLGLSPS